MNVALMVKNPPTSAGDLRMRVRPLHGKVSLAEGMTIHSSILAYRIPKVEETGRL